MTARQVDRAAARLDGLRDQRRSRLAMSAAAAACAAIAVILSTALAISVGIGVAAMLALAVTDTFRRRELLARLALNPNAYVVPDVKRYGEHLTVPRGRRRLAKALERVVSHADTPHSYCIAARVHRFHKELEGLAAALRSPEMRVEPTSVARCWRLLTSAAESPLYNWALPADELAFQVRQIQLGFRRPGGARD